VTSKTGHAGVVNVIANSASVRDILIIGSIGIGNLLLFSAALRLIRRHFAHARIAVVVLKESFRALYENDPNVDRIIVLDVNKVKTAVQKAAFLRNLRRTRYQLCITTFPANRLEYNLLAWLSGARVRIAHAYNSKRFKSLSFLQNVRVPVDKSVHDLDQNLYLLRPLGIPVNPSDRGLYLKVGGSAVEQASSYLDGNRLVERPLVGMHPGSSVERGMILKRWPAENFAAVCDRVAGQYGAGILLFGGREELPLREEIAARAESRPHIVDGIDFQTTAALIGKCACFITNDSGLMHVSAAMGVKTVALFGPTDPGRTAPFGDGHGIVRLGLDCSPCWSIHNLGVGMVRCVHPENICMTQMTIDSVMEKVSRIMKEADHA